MTVVFILMAVTAVIAVTAGIHRVRQPKLLMFQWGKFQNSRLGIKSSQVWEEEPDLVWYDDYKYWIRVKPNPGFNLPKLGYWSKAKGRKK